MKHFEPFTYKGFTLIEVMVALGIVAVGLLAISTALTNSIDVSQQLDARTTANWVASNRMAELRMNRSFTTGGSQSSQENMAGQDWKIVDNYFSTEDPNIVRVVIEVFVDGEDFPVSTNVGFLARYKPPTQ